MDVRTHDPGSRDGDHIAVDSRMLQANERTLLAWVRTGIALMTLGFVIARIGVWLRALAETPRAHDVHPFGTAWIGAAFVVLGAGANAMSLWRYLKTRRAIRAGHDIADDWFPLIFTVVVIVLGTVVGGYLVVRLV